MLALQRCLHGPKGSLRLTHTQKSRSSIPTRSVHTQPLHSDSGAPLVIHPDGVTRPKSTAAYKRQEMAAFRAHNAEINAKAAAAGFKQPWLHKMSFIIARPPILAPVPEEWEVGYQTWKDKWDEPIKAQIPSIQPLLDEDTAKKQDAVKEIDTSGMDEEQIARIKRSQEIMASEAAEVVIKVGSRITEADKTNDTKSLRRQLDQKLFLVVKKSRDQHSWQFPQAPLPLEMANEKKQLRDIARESLVASTGSSVDLFMTGNGPCGFYTYPFPSDLQKSLNTYGSKLFFYKGYYVKGNVIRPKRYVDHAWVTKTELKNYIQDENLCRYLDGVLI